jgi:hypothetical protein
MLTCWLLQGSLLVAPMAMGDAPPETRATAMVSFLDKRLPADEILEWWKKAQGDGREFEAYARACAAKPTESRRGLFGTYARSMIAQIPGDDLFSIEVGQTGDEPVLATDGASTHIVTRRIERDAACRQIFVAGTDETARAKADAILRELKAGADFAKLAREKSDDRASALRGGDLAIYERGPSDALLRAAAFETKVGELAGPAAARRRVGARARDPGAVRRCDRRGSGAGARAGRGRAHRERARSAHPRRRSAVSGRERVQRRPRRPRARGRSRLGAPRDDEHAALL